MKHMNEHHCELIERVKNGDESAFEELYHEFFKLAYYFAYKLCRNEADANDVVQDTFIEIHRSISTLKENAYFKAWMYKIVHSKCKKLFRKNKYITSDLENEPMSETIMENRREFMPEQFVHFTSDQEALQACLDALPESQRAILVLFYLEQMSIKEIADILVIPVGTVKSRLSYGRSCLKKVVDEYEKKNGQSIDFYELDALIAVLLTRELAKTIHKAPAITMKKTHLSSKASYAIGTKVAGGLLSICLAAVGVHQILHHDESASSSTGNDVEQRLFISQQVNQETIDNAQDAYFTLIEWACCEKMISQKSDDEISIILPLYQELKRYGGAYYDQLAANQWTTALEKRINH